MDAITARLIVEQCGIEWVLRPHHLRRGVPWQVTDIRIPRQFDTPQVRRILYNKFSYLPDIQKITEKDHNGEWVIKAIPE